MDGPTTVDHRRQAQASGVIRLKGSRAWVLLLTRQSGQSENAMV